MDEQLKKIQDENAKTEKTFVVAPAKGTAAAKTAPAKPAKGAAPAKTAAPLPAASTTAVVSPRPYLDSSKKIAASLEPTLNKKLQLREKTNEIEKLQVMLEETKRDQLSVQAIQKTEQTSVLQMETQVT